MLLDNHDIECRKKFLTKEAKTGSKIVAVAVFDVNSVKNVRSTAMTKAMTKFGTESRAVS